MTNRLVVYSGEDEIIVAALENEAQVLELYNDRNFDEYDRTETLIGVSISGTLHVDTCERSAWVSNIGG